MDCSPCQNDTGLEFLMTLMIHQNWYSKETPLARPCEDFLERFWSKVEMIPFHTCWEWIGAGRTGLGYGRIGGGGADGKLLQAHRVSYEIHNGQIPKGFEVCHSCDNPSCVNPHHLFIGPHIDNAKDMVNKNRQAKGSANGFSKLTEQEVIKIRKLLSNGAKQYDLANQFGISQTHISEIKLRKVWKHL